MFSILESFFSSEPEPIIVIPDKKTSKKVSKKNRKKKPSKIKVNKKNQKVYENVVQRETEIVRVETRNEKLYNRANELICQKNKKIKSLKAFNKHLEKNVKHIILKETSERDVMIENKDVMIRNKDEVIKNKDEMMKQLLEENEKLQKKVYTFLVDNENLREKIDTNMIEHEKDIKCLVDYTVQLHREINTLHEMDDCLGEKYSDTLAKLNKLKTEMALRNKEINGLIYSNGKFRYERNMFKEQLEKELKVKKESERYAAHLEKNVKKILKHEVEDIVGIIMKEYNKVYEDRISELMEMIPPPHILEKIKVDNNIRPICFNEASIVTERTNDPALSTLSRPHILEQRLIIDDERVISSVELTPESQGSPVSDTTSSDSDFLPTYEKYIMETMIEVEENVQTSKSLTSTSEDMNVMPMSSMELNPESQKLPVSGSLSSFFDFLPSCDNRASLAGKYMMETIVEVEENVKTSEVSNSTVESNEINKVAKTEASSVIKQFYDSVRQLVDCSDMDEIPALDSHCQKRTKERQITSNHLWRTPPLQICEQQMIVNDERSMSSMELSPVSEDLSESETVPPNFELLTTLDNRTWSTETSDMETIVEAEENAHKSEPTTSAVEADEIKEVENTEASSVIKQFYDSVRQLVDFNISEMEEIPSLDGHYKKITAPRQTNSNHLWRTPPIHICQQKMIVDDKRPMSSMELSPVSEDLPESETVPPNFELLTTLDNRTWSTAEENVLKSESTTSAVEAVEIKEVANTEASSVIKQFYDSVRQLVDCNISKIEEIPSLDGHCEKRTDPRQKNSNHLWRTPPIHICEQRMIVDDKKPMFSMELSPVSEDLSESENVSSDSNLWRTCENKTWSDTSIVETIVEESSEKTSKSSVSTIEPATPFNKINEMPNHEDTIVTEQVDELETRHTSQFIIFNMNDFPSLNGKVEKTTHQRQTDSNNLWSIPPLHICQEQTIVGDKRPMSSMELSPVSEDFSESKTVSSGSTRAWSTETSVATIKQLTESDNIEKMRNLEHTMVKNQVDDIETPNVPQFIGFNLNDVEEFPSLNGNCEKRTHQQQTNSNHVWEQQVIVDDETPMSSMGLTLVTKYLPKSGTAFSYFDILPTCENRTESPTTEKVIEVQEHIKTSKLSDSTVETNETEKVERLQISSVTEQIIQTAPQFTDFNMTDMEEFPSLNGHEERTQPKKENSKNQWRSFIARSENSQTWPN